LTLPSGAAATGHGDATEIALKVLGSGGTAADAAVAAAFALFVLMPEACGLGGDAFAVVTTPHESLALNGSGDAPAEWANGNAGTGAATATVPGAVGALAQLHARCGGSDWGALIAPAVSLADGGILVSPTLRAAMARRSTTLDITARDWSIRQGHHTPDSKVPQPALASVLRSIAADGSAAFYEGWIGRELARSTRESGGLLSEADLARHTTDINSPVSIEIGDWVVHASPPVSQGVLIPFALTALHHASTTDTARAHLLAETLEEGFVWRPRLDDGAAVDSLPWTWTPPGQQARRLVGARGTAHTTSVCTADSQGMVVSLLISVFHEFGSGHLVPQLGFFLNDRILGFRDTQDRRARRPVHTLAPVIVASSTTCVALATPGADAQVQVLSQVLDAVLHEGDTWDSALSRPRWRLEAGQLVIEDDADPDLITALKRWGHDVRIVARPDHAMGAVTIAGWSQAAGAPQRACFAFADGRRGNSASQRPR
jgi:gamma-glutamyltranspeptidase/glutathione hydrolase